MNKQTPSLMYMVGPNKDEKLIQRYNQYRQDPKKDNVLISTIYRAAQSVEDSPIPKKARDQVINDRGFSTDSFLEMLKFPISARPSTFQECVDFFYPHSGIRSRPNSKAPFISTYVGAYEHPDNPSKWGDPTKNTIPASLGEVSMMYGWFIIYRLLLCPITFNAMLLDPGQFFRPTDRQRVLNKKAVRRAQIDANSQITKLSYLKTAVNIASSAAKQYINAGAPDVSSLDVNSVLNFVKSNSEIQQLLARGTNAITELISDQMGWDRKSSALVTSYLVEGLMSPEKFAQLKNIQGSAVIIDTIQAQAEDELENLYKLSSEDARLLARSSDFAITGKAPSKEVEAKLSESGKQFLKEKTAKNASKFVGDFISSELDKGKGGARPNDPILIGLGISLGAKAISAHIDEQKAQALRDASKKANYYTSVLYELDPMFSESGYSFSFESYENDGLLKDHSWMSGMDLNTRLPQPPRDFRDRVKRYASEKEYWTYYPTCALQNGGEMLSFWTEIYKIYRPAIAEYRVDSARGGSVLEALNRASKLPLKFADRFPCKTFNVFYKTTIASTIALMKNLPAYSPFTHMFGFAPTILFNDPKTQGFKELNALKKSLGGPKLPDMVVIGAPTAKYLERTPTIDTATRFHASAPWPQSFSPDQKEFFTFQKTPYLASGKLTDKNTYLSDWKSSDLQKSEEFRKKFMGDAFTVNSQRVLQDAFGGVLSVGFDVALGIPIFNAQWAALMSVLFCYPEALDTLAQAGIKWAVALKKSVDEINKANVVIKDAVTSAKPVKSMPKSFVPKVTPSAESVKAAVNILAQQSFKSPLVDQALSKSDSINNLVMPINNTAAPKKETATEPKKSNTTLYVLGGLAVAAAVTTAVVLRKK